MKVYLANTEINIGYGKSNRQKYHKLIPDPSKQQFRSACGLKIDTSSGATMARVSTKMLCKRCFHAG